MSLCYILSSYIPIAKLQLFSKCKNSNFPKIAFPENRIEFPENRTEFPENRTEFPKINPEKQNKSRRARPIRAQSMSDKVIRFLEEHIPYCKHTLLKYPEEFIEECMKVPLEDLMEWATRENHYVEVDAGGMYMRFPGNKYYNFDRIRIEKLLEEPFGLEGLKPEYKPKVYKPILLRKRGPDNECLMALDKGLKVPYYEHDSFPSCCAPMVPDVDAEGSTGI